jgi:cytochrome c5
MTNTSKLKTAFISALLTLSATAMASDNDAKKTYDEACGVCHNVGVAGAPKFGDLAAWAPRIATGKDALYTTALKGKGAMPAKGGRADISDDKVKATVDYMVANSSSK